MSRQFIVVGNDYSGLGWVKKLTDEGERALYAYEYDPPKDDFKKPDDRERFDRVGSGYVEKLPIEQSVKKHANDKDTYWIFDSNHMVEWATHLRDRGCKVFGATNLSADLEHDRAEAMQLAEEAGLDIAEMIECKTVEEGVKFLEDHEDTAYVFKPNDSSLHYLTFVPTHDHPEVANTSLRAFLSNFDGPMGASKDGGFVLQERHEGVEVNFELWLDRGEPILATCGLESKRVLNDDLGEHCGCSQDVMFIVPMDCPGVQQTIAKTLPMYPKTYTGMIDVNVILADNKVWFLEVCDRFGYSAHPNLFLTLALDTFGDLMADWMNGYTDDFAKRFRSGFGASVNLTIEHPRKGWPIMIHDREQASYYPYDLYYDKDQAYLAGYSKDVGVVAKHGYTIPDAAKSCLDVLHKQHIWFPDMGYRTDLAKGRLANSPLKRYEALKAMGMV